MRPLPAFPAIAWLLSVLQISMQCHLHQEACHDALIPPMCSHSTLGNSIIPVFVKTICEPSAYLSFSPLDHKFLKDRDHVLFSWLLTPSLMPVWMKYIACRISKQRMLQPSSHHIIAAPMVSPEGTQDGDKQAAHCQALRYCRHPQLCTLRGFRMEKSRRLAQIAEVHFKGMISVSPDSCFFPYIEKC